MSDLKIEIIEGPLANINAPITFQVTLPSGAVMTRPFDEEIPTETYTPEFIVTASGEIITLISA